MTASLSPPPVSSHTILGNIGAQMLSRVVTMVISFALLPFMIAHVGKESYGLYLLILSVTGYFSVLDFGVYPAVVKYVAESRARGDAERLQRVVNSALTFYAGVGAVVALLLAGAALLADRLFAFETGRIAVSRQLLLVAAAGGLVLWPTTVFRAAVEGFQRYDVAAAVETAMQVLRAVAVVAALTLGCGVVALLVILNLTTLATNLILFGCLHRWAPPLRLAFHVSDQETFRLVFGFSAYLFVGALTSLVIFQLDYLIVGALISLPAVTSFGVAYTLHAAIKTLDNLIGGPPWAASADFEGRGDLAAQRRLLIRGTRYIALFLLPVVIVTIAFAGPLIEYWMGPGFEDSVLPARILVSSWLLISLWQTGGGILTTKGVLRIPLLLALVHAVLHATLSLALARPLGLAGVALGTVIPVALLWLPTMIYVTRTLRLGFGEFVARSLRDAVAPLAATAALAAAILWQWPPTSLTWTLGQMGAIYVSIVGLIGLWILDADDRRLARDLWNRFRQPVLLHPPR